MTPNIYQKSVGSHLVQGPQYGDFVLGRYTRLFFECEIGLVGPLFVKVYRHRHANDPNGYANDCDASRRYTRFFRRPPCEGRQT